MNLNYQLILASNSPRRQALLKELGLNFIVRSQTVNEDFPKNINVKDVAEYLALKKANECPLYENELVITADTVVIANGVILGKPKDAKEAITTLERLSNNTHIVTTGVCLKTNEKQKSFSEHTEVTFKKLSISEIEHYVQTFKPFDKAGAYGIQEWIGMVGIKKIKGDYYNVVGMPLHTLWHELKKFQ